MKKFTFLIIITLLLSNLFGISEFACMFTMINPSATDVTFGLNSGTANIWNTSPLSVWSNPAKLGYHNSFAFGYSNDQCYESAYFASDVYHQSSYISYGWNGIGILLPAPSAKNRWGTLMNYGEEVWMDEDGNLLATFESFKSCSKFAIGINTLELISNFIKNENFCSLQAYGDLSCGLNYDVIHSELAPIGGSGTTPVDLIKSKADTHSSGIGFISRISPFNKINATGKLYRLDLTVGIYYLNPERTEITYKNESQSDPMPFGTRSAVSGKFSIDLGIIPNIDNTGLRDFINNLFSVNYSQDNAQYGNEDEANPSIWGEGIEFTFFDILSIRKGQHVDRSSEIVGDTSGFGINLNYKNIFQFQYNYAKFPGSELQVEQEKTDYMVRIDFLKTYELFKE